MSFIVHSAIRQLIKDNDRRCSDEFLETLDGVVKNIVIKACEDPNDGMKTLGEAVLLSGGTKAASKKQDRSAEIIKEIKTEAVAAEMKIKVLTQKEFSKAMGEIIEKCNLLLEAS